ncbi:FCHSD [Mytilus coruscus]|uniref:FCHSD n=1 Tax=Mytilus coruscus TaxID=42192 RepID=A0A6J8BCV5_MYTCO|nr:FCHSD [Mytilus coruscus]
MQPPPRKVKHAAVLKNIHSEQVSKLQAKHQQECELLEDIRNFSRQRSIIEKDYAQSLMKLTTSLLKREFSATPDLTTDDGQEHKMALKIKLKLHDNYTFIVDYARGQCNFPCRAQKRLYDMLSQNGQANGYQVEFEASSFTFSLNGTAYKTDCVHRSGPFYVLR